LQLGEVAEIEAQMFSFAQKFNRRTAVQFSTEPAILPNCCYAFALLFLSSVLLSFLVCFVVRWKSKLFCNFWNVFWLEQNCKCACF